MNILLLLDYFMVTSDLKVKYYYNIIKMFLSK